MNFELIKRWNSVVTPQDTVYVLGDFCWKLESEWQRITPQLNGSKVLIVGNHDPKKFSGRMQKLFQDIKLVKTIDDGEYRVVMCHYPILFYPGDYKEKTIMLCGHVHVTEENDLLNEFVARIRKEREKSGKGNHGRIINVGAMMPWMDYTPRTLKEILERTGL